MTTVNVRSPSVPRLVVHQLTYERKSYWRNPLAALFTFAFPVMFLVVFASLNVNDNIGFYGGINYNQYYVPAIAAFGVISACYSYLGVQICIRRDAGIFKRLRGTPLPAVALMAGLVTNAVINAVMLLALTLAVGTAFYGLVWYGHLLALGCAVVLGAACFCALGIAISTIVPNGEAAPAVVNFALFPLTFISGTFFPVRQGRVIAHIASVFPIQPFTQAVFAPFDPRRTGLAFTGHNFLVLGLWTAGATVVAIRRFRWDPKAT